MSSFIVGDFRPISGIEYVGKNFLVGEMARRQSQPRVMMEAEWNFESMVLMSAMP